jgi:hypothetical protein
MLTNKNKKILLDNLLNSPEFEKSKRNQELLKYLVSKELNGINVKESTIAIEFYNKDANFNPGEDTIVRVGIASLRKKLDHYYLTEGRYDTVQICIPKGAYNVVFKSNKSRFKNIIKKSASRSKIFILITVIFFSIILYLFYENYSLRKKFHPLKTNNPVWNEFINAKKPNYLALGDYFFMYKPYKQYRLFIRDPRINSFDEYTKKNSIEQDLLPLEFSYLLPSVATQIIEIMPVLNMSDNPVKYLLSSEISSSDFNKNNVIYIGSYKSLYILEQLLPLFNLKIINDSIGYTLKRLDNDGNIIQSYELPRVFQDNYYTDYSYIGKIKGPGDNTIMIISGGDNIGITEAMKIVISKNFENLIQEYDTKIKYKSPFYFHMIIKTEGLKETGFNHEIVFFEKINSLNS